MAAQQVFDGEALRATLFNADAKRLFVSFRQRVDDFGSFSEARPVLGFTGAGYAHLHIQARMNDWYINAETSAFEARMSELGAGYKAACAMGFSMGGYGVLRFARALGLSRAIVVSGQVSIHPNVVPWDKRYRHYATGFDQILGDVANHGKPDLAGVLLFDPLKKLDRRNAEMMAQICPKMQLCPLTGGGHPATKVLRMGGHFRKLQQMLRDGIPARADILALHKEARADSAFYWRNLGEAAQKRGHLACAAHATAMQQALA